MKHIKKRLGKIVDELINYFFTMGATNIQINLEETKEFYKIFVHSDYLPHHEKKITKLIKCLESPKQEAMEEYFWELAGECDTDTELTLVGMMIDEGEIQFTDDRIEVTLYRQK
ncbi:hypothetical protein QBE52_14885 [Clostridiaceae bacterium 35-E11]